jgi:nickel-dependent lactate racemase
MPPLVADAGPDRRLSLADQEALLERALAAIGGQPKRVLLVPPDYTRANSGTGPLTAMLYRRLSRTAHVDILPAIGTHVPMTEHEIRAFFGPDIPLDHVLVHDWRNGLEHQGDIAPELIRQWSDGRCDFPVRIEINQQLTRGRYDLILSLGQIVPHEVVGMANYTKNICVGVGGRDTINKSHFLGAAYGMERIMGQADSPPRRVFNYGCQTYLRHLPIWYILTVMEKDHAAGCMHMRGLYVGNDDATFLAGCRLAQQVNINLLDAPLRKVVVYLDPHEFKSTWLGNKAVYRTRMAIADGGELIVLAPALREFGEDPTIDKLIRKYGYRTTPEILRFVQDNADLRDNLSAAAHLIHGSSEGRFTITYCPGPKVSLDAVRAVGYQAADLAQMTARYNPERLRDGMNDVNGEQVFYISNPALGLWALRSRFQQG